MTMPKAGADELRIRSILRTREVGPDAIPPKPTARPRDWLDDVIDTDLAPAPAEPEEEPEAAAASDKPKPAAKARKRKRRRRKQTGPDTPRSAWDTELPSPRQSLLDAWGAVPYRLKWLAYHATAAYLGWSTGLVDYATYVTAWIAATSLVSLQAIFWYAVGATTLLLHHATRRRWWLAAWLAAVPASSTVVGVLLYGTGYQP
ncbi:hypothetical protein ACFWFF_01500 [Streptomyces sp. NPDC060223]|uniref:hypothetical protein n=1 Tax=unclassified Streptomyces TaxID=2593676 RepID=UPI00363C21E4